MIEAIKKRIKHLSNEAQHAIIKSAIIVLPGTEFVSEKEAETRLNICENCVNLNKETRRCKLCECFVDEKTRIKKFPFLTQEECPDKKW